MRTEEGRVFWGEGVNWGQKYWTKRSREDTGGGSFEKQGSTGDRADKLEKGQLAAQDPRSGDVGFSNVFFLLLCSRSFHWWPVENIDWEGSIVVYESSGPQKARPYNGIFSTVSHTFTILISNFPQRWNKYFTETVAVINPNPKENWKLDWYKIYCFQTDAKYQIWSRNMNLSIFQQMLREIPVYRQERAEELWRPLDEAWEPSVSHKLEPSQCYSLRVGIAPVTTSNPFKTRPTPPFLTSETPPPHVWGGRSGQVNTNVPH